MENHLIGLVEEAMENLSTKQWYTRMRREFATKQRHEQWFEAIREHQITGSPIVVPPVVARRAERRAA
eukprot:2365890-Karenia_brevis.AAC.1